jgi:hypothetical protein
VPFSLTVSPARFVLEAGETHTVQFFDVSDSGLQSLHVDVSLTEFSQAPSGETTFAPPGPLSAASWVQAEPTSFDLDPGEHQAVMVTIDVPSSPEPGERQVGVLFGVPPQAAGENVAIGRAIGIPLLIGVPGVIIHKDSIGPLRTPRWSDGGPVPVELTLSNEGNVHRDYIRPNNLVAVARGTQRIAFSEVTVLRNSTRVIQTQWTDPPLLCICTIRVTSDDGQGHVLTAEARVVLVPLRLILGILLTLLGLLLLTQGRRRRRKRREAELVELGRQEGYAKAASQLGSQPPSSGSEGARPGDQDL